MPENWLRPFPRPIRTKARVTLRTPSDVLRVIDAMPDENVPAYIREVLIECAEHRCDPEHAQIAVEMWLVMQGALSSARPRGRR